MGASRLRPGHAGLCPLICEVMPSRAALCRRLPEGALRICSRPDGGAKRHLVDLVQPDHATAGGQPPATRDLLMPGVPSGRRVIALREVDEMARTRSLPPSLLAPVRMADHLGDLPARRGHRSCSCDFMRSSCRLPASGQPCVARGPAGGPHAPRDALGCG